MDISQRTVMLAGIAMVLTAIMMLVSVGLSAGAMSDKDPFDRAEVAEFLSDVHDNDGWLIGGGATGIVTDGFLVVTVGAALYVLFRDRNPFLATLTVAAITATAAIALVVDISNILLTFVARDYVQGGPGGIPAHDHSTLEVGRYLGMITFAFLNTAFVPGGVAFLAIGSLLLWSPEGRINPPKWLGWIAIIAGLASELAWLVVAAGVFFIFFPIQLIALLIFFVVLGIWLVQHQDLQPAPMQA